MNMSTNSKRLLFACLGALLLGIAILWVAPPGTRYRAISHVVVSPFTNAVFTRSFESNVVQRIPGGIRLRVFPSYSALATPTTPAITNGVGIEIMVDGASWLEAQRLANDAAVTVCATARQLYGGSADVIDTANQARPYSVFYDNLQRGVARLFKR